VWDVASQSKLLHKEVKDLNTLVFSPDGSLVVSLGRAKLEVWDSHTGEIKRTLVSRDDRCAISQVVFDRGGTRAFALNTNGTIDAIAF
jgi:WD40 repeat protein